LDLINFQKRNTRRADGESRAEVFSLRKIKKNKSASLFPQRSALCLSLYVFSLVVLHLSANNCTNKMHSILGASKYEREVSMLSLQSIN